MNHTAITAVMRPRPSTPEGRGVDRRAFATFHPTSLERRGDAFTATASRLEHGHFSDKRLLQLCVGDGQVSLVEAEPLGHRHRQVLDVSSAADRMLLADLLGQLGRSPAGASADAGPMLAAVQAVLDRAARRRSLTVGTLRAVLVAHQPVPWRRASIADLAAALQAGGGPLESLAVRAGVRAYRLTRDPDQVLFATGAGARLCLFGPVSASRLPRER
ncbi:MAG: hypothetical protein JNK82_20015 [Myxococcaceae bacterium]|nr:hypothetical protein [Myxococcaceae bacterium]